MTTPLRDDALLDAFDALLAKVQHPDVFPKLAPLGYDAADLAADQTLLAGARAARTTQQKEYAEARAASVAEDQTQATVNSALVQLHKLINLVHRRNKALNLPHILSVQKAPRTEATQLSYFTGLLDRIQANPDAVSGLGAFGVDATRIADMRALITSAHAAGTTHATEQAEAEKATALYRENLEQVRLALSTLLTLTHEGVKGHPELQAMFD